MILGSLLGLSLSHCIRPTTSGNVPDAVYAPVSAVQPGRACVIDPAVWLCHQRSSRSKKLGELHAGDSVVVLSHERKGWAKIQWQGQKGYVGQASISGDYAAGIPEAERQYYTSTRGGCYYLSNDGSKTYVNRSLCGTVASSSQLPEPSYEPAPAADATLRNTPSQKRVGRASVSRGSGADK